MIRQSATEPGAHVAKGNVAEALEKSVVKRAAFGAALLLSFAPAGATTNASGTIDATAPGVRIAPEIYGQFAEELGRGIEDGLWVGPDSSIPNINGYRRDVVDALRDLHVPDIRWPGGCYADSYHWRNGIGARSKRPVTINYSWGGSEQHNAFGTHEYFDFAELVGAKTYLGINVGTGSPQEARDWIEYIVSSSHSTLANERRANGREKPWGVDYIGIGNEMWGCGGNLKPEEYSPILRRYATFLRTSNAKLVASGASDRDYHWTEVMMEAAGKSGGAPAFDAVSLHYYTIPTGKWDHKGAATGFPESEWASTLRRTRDLEEIIERHSSLMDKSDPDKKIALAVDEWGTWYDETPGTSALWQQNTLRDALVAATNFHIFQRHADRVRMANIAQMVNVLQAMILTRGAQMVKTPTYYAFLMYRPFQGATALPVSVTSQDYGKAADRIPAIDVTAARGADGAVYVGLINADPHERADVQLSLIGGLKGSVSGQLLTAPRMDSHNAFGEAEQVHPVPFHGARLSHKSLIVAMPAKSVVVLKL